MTKAQILKKHGLSEEEFYKKYPTQEHYIKEFGEGGSIHIKPENRGKFTAYKERTGKTTEEALHSPNAHVRQMANFAKNAAKWKHEEGGQLAPSRITPEISRFDDGGNLSYNEQIGLQTNQFEIDKWKTNEQRAFNLKKAKENSYANSIVGGLNSITSAIPNSNTGNKVGDFYNNSINQSNKLASGLLQTGLGIAGTAIAGPAGGSVGSSLGSAVGKLFGGGGTIEGYNNDVSNYQGTGENYKIYGADKGNIGGEMWVDKSNKKIYPYLNFNKDIGKNTNINLSLPVPINGNNTFGIGITKTFKNGGQLNKYTNNLFANGGALNKVNSNNNPQLTRYSGLTHAQGGIALGKTGNEVETGETRVGDNIFSNQIKYDKNKTFADMSKKIDNKFSKRDNDKISSDTKKIELNNLFERQEKLKAFQSKTKFGSGGGLYDVPTSEQFNTNSLNFPIYNDNGNIDYTAKKLPINPTMLNADTGSFTGSLENKNMLQVDNQPTSELGKPSNNFNNNFPTYVPNSLGPVADNSIDYNQFPTSNSKNARVGLMMQKSGQGLEPIKPKAPIQTPVNMTPAINTKLPAAPINKKIVDTDTNKKNLDLSWLNSAAQLGLTALGNYKPLAVKNYQMKPELLDSTQAKRENRDAFSGVNSDLKTSGLSGGQYLASRMGTASQEAGKNSEIDNAYRSANVGVKNQFKQFNNATDKEVQELNAKEIDASKTARQVRNQNMAGIIGGYGQDRGRQEAVIPEGHEAIYDKYGRIKSFRKISTGETIPVK